MVRQGGAKMGSYKRRKNREIPWRALLKGAAVSMLTSVVLILILTLFVYLGWFRESAISISNTVIKALAAVAAGAAVGRHRTKTAWWYGAIAAAGAQIVLWVLMSVYLGEWNTSWGLAADILLSIAIGGAVSALILRKRT